MLFSGEESRAVQTSNSVGAKSSLVLLAFSLFVSFTSFNLPFSHLKIPFKKTRIPYLFAFIIVLSTCHIFWTLVYNGSFVHAIFCALTFHLMFDQIFWFSFWGCFGFAFRSVFEYGSVMLDIGWQTCLSSSISLRNLFTLFSPKMSIKLFGHSASIKFISSCCSAILNFQKIKENALTMGVFPKCR